MKQSRINFIRLFVTNHKLVQIEDIYEVLRKKDLSKKDEQVLRWLQHDDCIQVFFDILKVPYTPNNKTLLKTVLENKHTKISLETSQVQVIPQELIQPVPTDTRIQITSFLDVQEEIQNVLYNIISDKEAEVCFFNSMKAYGAGVLFNQQVSITQDNKEDKISLSTIVFNSFVNNNLFFDHLGDKAKYFTTKLHNLGYRLIIAHGLNVKNFKAKADPYYTIKETVASLVKPICSFKEFKEISLSNEITRKEVLETGQSVTFYDKINHLIKETNFSLRSSIQKLIFIKVNLDSVANNVFHHLLNMMHRFCPNGLNVYNKDYHFILNLLKAFNKQSTEFILACEPSQRKQIENYLEELNSYFKIIAIVNTRQPNAIDWGILFHQYNVCIINKSYQDFFDKKVKMSKNTFSRLIRAFDYCIPFFQSIVIKEALPRLAALERTGFV